MRGRYASYWNTILFLLYKSVNDTIGNGIEALPRGAFRDLQSLSYLYVYRNSLTAIRAGMWEGLDSLAHLDLPANRIRVLEPGAFAGEEIALTDAMLKCHLSI